MTAEYSDQELDQILNKVNEWGLQFSKSPYFENLTKDQKQESEFIVMTFSEYMYSYEGLSPEEWDEAGLEECCVHTLARKVSAETSYYQAMSPVLEGFFRFLDEQNLLRRASRLATKVKSLAKQIEQAADDPRNWGMAKSFVMAAQSAGVDPSQKGDMQKFMMEYNQQLLEKNPISSPQIPLFGEFSSLSRNKTSTVKKKKNKEMKKRRKQKHKRKKK